MTDTDTIPVSASIASTGLGIRYIGDHAYAYSGLIASSGTEASPISILEFTSGAGLIVAEFSCCKSDPNTEEGLFAVTLNEGVVAKQFFRTNQAGYDEAFPIVFKIIIPPFTKVQLLSGFENPSGDVTGSMTGRVYGEE